MLTPKPTATPSPTPTPTPTSTPTQTPTQSPTPTLTPTPSSTSTSTQNSIFSPTSTPSPSPKPTPSPTPIFNSSTLQAIFSNGSIVDLGVNGITAFSVTNATISTNQLAAQTTLSLTIIGQDTTNNVNTISVPKTAVPYGVTPKIYVNTQVALGQGFSQDANNFYVWYKTVFSNYELSIVFAPNALPVEFPLVLILAIVGIIIFSLSISAVVLKKRKESLVEDNEYSTYC
jgi:hypothetical protein